MISSIRKFRFPDVMREPGQSRGNGPGFSLTWVSPLTEQCYLQKKKKCMFRNCGIFFSYNKVVSHFNNLFASNKFISLFFCITLAYKSVNVDMNYK